MDYLIKTSCVLTSMLFVMLFVIFMFAKTIKYDRKLYSHQTLSLYVADVPDIYVTGVYGTGLVETNLQYGHTSLGALLSIKHEQWASIWHSVIAWYIDQIKTSPIRTYDAAAADIIFVPAILHQENPTQHEKFITEADQFLPYLNTKPHVIILSHAPNWYSNLLLNHNNSNTFVFVSWGGCPAEEEAREGQLDGFPSNVIRSPAFSFVHWSRGSKQLQAKERIFDTDATEKLKTILVVESFVLRTFPDRFAIYEDCKGAPEKCKHLDFEFPKDAVPVYEAFQSAWYVMHPRGDFVIRNSLFDTLLADAIPVVFQPEYINSVPFNDVLNYTKIAVYIPEKDILGENRTNVVKKLADEFDKKEALSRIEYIHNIKHIFQYMLNPDHELIRWDQRSIIHPGDDAFTFTMKSVLRNLCSRKLGLKRCGIFERLIATHKHLY